MAIHTCLSRTESKNKINSRAGQTCCADTAHCDTAGGAVSGQSPCTAQHREESATDRRPVRCVCVGGRLLARILCLLFSQQPGSKDPGSCCAEHKPRWPPGGGAHVLLLGAWGRVQASETKRLSPGRSQAWAPGAVTQFAVGTWKQRRPQSPPAGVRCARRAPGRRLCHPGALYFHKGPLCEDTCLVWVHLKGG